MEARGYWAIRRSAFMSQPVEAASLMLFEEARRCSRSDSWKRVLVIVSPSFFRSVVVFISVIQNSHPCQFFGSHKLALHNYQNFSKEAFLKKEFCVFCLIRNWSVFSSRVWCLLYGGS